VRLAIIPARGGSKRIPRKNIRAFEGRPIIDYSIAASRASGLFDRIVVSTDDAEIAEVARRSGADVPFVRPAALADDHAATVPVVRHAIDWCAEHGTPADEVCCVYATAPFVTAAELRAAHELLSAGIDFVFTAARFHFPPQRGLLVDANGLVRPLLPEAIAKRSQDLPPVLHDAGQFYWGTAAAWQRHELIFCARARAYELPAERVQDIDTADDWARAEGLYRRWKERACASPSA
jgi:pseudaminic acid cytidylyltransferase